VIGTGINAVHETYQIDIFNSRFIDNSATYGGAIGMRTYQLLQVDTGSFYWQPCRRERRRNIHPYGAVSATNSTLFGNSAGTTGGGIFMEPLVTSMTSLVTNSTIAGNTAGTGSGGIVVSNLANQP